MRIVAGLSALTRPPARVVVAIGMFDGVHVGHQHLIQTAVRLARRWGGTSVVMTFHPDPQRVLRPQTVPPALMPLEERLRLIESLGADVAWVIPFTRRFARSSAGAFAERILRQTLRASAVVVGSNFSFGKDRRGGIAFLRRFCARTRLHLVVVPPVVRAGAPVSSSRIRALVQHGDVVGAARLLGRAVTLSGIVSRGAGRGRRLGFPTANLSRCSELLPAHGVYRVRVYVGGSRRGQPGLMNVGVRPTFRAAAEHRAAPPICEIYLPEFRGTLYGRHLHVKLLARLRGERRFAHADTLIRQIRRDLRRAGLPASASS